MKLLVHLGHDHAPRRIVKAFKIGLGPEQINAAIGSFIRFESLEYFLPIMQNCRGGMNREILEFFDRCAIPTTRCSIALHEHMIGEIRTEIGIRWWGALLLCRHGFDSNGLRHFQLSLKIVKLLRLA